MNDNMDNGIEAHLMDLLDTLTKHPLQRGATSRTISVGEVEIKGKLCQIQIRVEFDKSSHIEPDCTIDAVGVNYHNN